MILSSIVFTTTSNSVTPAGTVIFPVVGSYVTPFVNDTLLVVKSLPASAVPLFITKSYVCGFTLSVTFTVNTKSSPSTATAPFVPIVGSFGSSGFVGSFGSVGTSGSGSFGSFGTITASGLSLSNIVPVTVLSTFPTFTVNV